MSSKEDKSNKNVSSSAHYWRLVPLLVIVLVVLVVLRNMLVPESFGEFGHYRGAALQELGDLQHHHLESTGCAECHEKKVKVVLGGDHKTVSCELCHGPGVKHAQDNDTHKMQVNKDPKLCLKCHMKLPGRPTAFPQIAMADHVPADFDLSKDSCIDCHGAHSPAQSGGAGGAKGGSQSCTKCHKDQIAEISEGSHAKLSCTFCHGPVSGGHFKRGKDHVAMKLKANPIKNLCLSCHKSNTRADLSPPQLKDVVKHTALASDPKAGDVCLDCHITPHAPVND